MLQTIFAPLASLAQTWIEGRVATSRARAEAQAQILVRSAESAADWERVMANNSGQSWKDEWLTILFSIPLVLAFVPDAVPYVNQGFEALAQMPEWYQYTLSVIVAASFGVRSAIGIFNARGRNNGS